MIYISSFTTFLSDIGVPEYLLTSMKREVLGVAFLVLVLFMILLLFRRRGTQSSFRHSISRNHDSFIDRPIVSGSDFLSPSSLPESERKSETGGAESFLTDVPKGTQKKNSLAPEPTLDEMHRATEGASDPKDLL